VAALGLVAPLVHLRSWGAAALATRVEAAILAVIVGLAALLAAPTLRKVFVLGGLRFGRRGGFRPEAPSVHLRTGGAPALATGVESTDPTVPVGAALVFAAPALGKVVVRRRRRRLRRLGRRRRIGIVAGLVSERLGNQIALRALNEPALKAIGVLPALRPAHVTAGRRDG